MEKGGGNGLNFRGIRFANRQRLLRCIKRAVMFFSVFTTCTSIVIEGFTLREIGLADECLSRIGKEGLCGGDASLERLSCTLKNPGRSMNVPVLISSSHRSNDNYSNALLRTSIRDDKSSIRIRELFVLSRQIRAYVVRTNMRNPQKSVFRIKCR